MSQSKPSVTPNSNQNSATGQSHLPNQTEGLLLYNTSNNIATITLNTPKSLNAFSTSLKNRLMQALETAESDNDVRVIVLQGSGGNFSSGGDIKEMLSEGIDGASDKLQSMVNGVGNVSLKLRNINKPIIAKLEGAVAGAGMNLALTCDFRIAAQSSKFSQAFVHIGLVPDAGGIYLLNQLVGAAKTTELVMLGDKISAVDMLNLNLVNQVVTEDDLDDAVNTLANRLSALPSEALATMKTMINVHAYSGLNEALDMEVHQQTRMAKTADFKEGVTAFIEKRQPVYNG